jgi:hypothetical protein
MATEISSNVCPIMPSTNSAPTVIVEVEGVNLRVIRGVEDVMAGTPSKVADLFGKQKQKKNAMIQDCKLPKGKHRLFSIK